jgi:hypothetical protein
MPAPELPHGMSFGYALPPAVRLRAQQIVKVYVFAIHKHSSRCINECRLHPAELRLAHRYQGYTTRMPCMYTQSRAWGGGSVFECTGPQSALAEVAISAVVTALTIHPHRLSQHALPVRLPMQRASRSLCTGQDRDALHTRLFCQRCISSPPQRRWLSTHRRIAGLRLCNNRFMIMENRMVGRLSDELPPSSARDRSNDADTPAGRHCSSC